MVFEQLVTCRLCEGYGYVFDSSNGGLVDTSCWMCKGKGYTIRDPDKPRGNPLGRANRVNLNGRFEREELTRV